MALATDIPISALGFNKRRTIRTEINPYDKSTVVSIFPKRIQEFKYSMMPGEFIIEAGSYDKPAILVVGTSSWWKDIDPEQPLLEIPVSSVLVADSIIKDYCNGYWPCDMGNIMLGLFFIPGKAVTVEEVKKDYKDLLDAAYEKQLNFYKALVRIADSFWAQSGGNPKTISDDMRMAALQMGIEREWIKDIHVGEMIRCVACGNLRNPSYPKCMHCRTIVDKALYDKLGLIEGQ